MKPTVVVCALNEEELIEECLQTLSDQDYPNDYEVILVDNGSTDKTKEIAEQYCKVVSAPKGKLNARVKGIEEAQGDIIIAVDADCHVPRDLITCHMRHYENPDVVAVKGSVIHTGSFVSAVLSVIAERSMRRLQGANSSFRKIAFDAVGGFDLSINQINNIEILAEEEIVFYNKMEAIGEIVWDRDAIVFHCNRGLHGSIAKDLRLTDKRSLEIIAGERF